MNLLQIVIRNLRQHCLSTSVTSVSIALAGALLMTVWIVREQSASTFRETNSGFDAVLGARGSQLQLVLNAVFHLEQSPGNVSHADYEEIAANPQVERAIPIAVGDNYLGYRIVGTTTNLFTDHEIRAGEKLHVRGQGRLFEHGFREAVVGSYAARRLGLKYGDKFQPFHGLDYDPAKKHEETYVVVGILEASNTPADRVIWIPLAGVQNMTGHDVSTKTQISAVLIKLRTPAAGMRMDLTYNRQGDKLTLAWPIDRTISQLFNKISWFDRVLELVAWLVAIVASGSILASIYNTMNERRRDIAIMRALGAHRTTILGSILLECGSIATIGMAMAYVIYAGLFALIAGIIRERTGIVLDPFQFHPVMLWAPALMIGLSLLAGLVPGWKAYRTSVADNLAPQS